MTSSLKLLLSVCLFFADGFLVNAFAVPTCRAISRRLHAKSEWQQDAYSSEKETDSGTENKQDDWQISDDFEGVTGDYDGTYFDDNDEMITGWSIPQQEDTEATSSHFFSRKDLYDPAFYNDKLVFEKLCQGVNLSSPSKIQAMAWPNLLQGKSAVIADQTGSGKTLAYLMPLIQRLKQSNLRPRVGTPKILVLAPTAELADQTFAVCNKLSTKLPSLSTMVVTATGNLNTSIRDQIRILQRKNMDILISTPGRIATILRTRQSGLDLSQLQALVLDEVDILWTDETFGPQLRTIGAAVTAETQFVFCTATLPDVVLTKVKQEFGNVMKIQGPGLHRVAPTIQERLIDVSVPARHNRDSQFCFNVKTRALLQALRTTRCRRTLVFCNTVESCRKVENLLNRRDRKGQVYRVYPYHNAMTAPARNENLRDFSNDESNDAILVCTDRAARGVDFAAAPVDHVVIFDFPRDPAEYIRRVGRTARAGRQGASTVLAYGWQLPIARSVMGKKVAVVESSVMDDFASTGGGDVDVDDSRIPKRAKRGQSAEDSIREKIERGRMWKEQKERIV